MNSQPLSPLAQRVLNLFHGIALGPCADVTWPQMVSALHCGRTSLAAAIRELKAAALVEQVNIHGQRARYRIQIAGQTSDTGDLAEADTPDTAVQLERESGAHQCGLVRTSADYFPSDLKNELNDDDDEALPEFQKLKTLLGEFLIKEPIRSQLAHALLPLVDKTGDIRAVCEKTLKEPVWKNPRGVMVRRLQAMANGLQDPLPVFQTVMAAPPIAPSRQQTTRRKGGVTLRPQIAEYTDEERAAANECARARNAARRAAQGVTA